MKKLKIMLLSLALFAVVGGALAFKAKYIQTVCSTDAYWDNVSYYCSFKPVGQATIYAKCLSFTQNSTYTTAADKLVRSFCTTTPVNGICPNTLTCSTSVTIVHD
jgi:hypothetical protein